MITIQSPYVQFTELDGSPLDDGAVYIGTAGLNPQTNPITVYWDNAGTQPVAQPISTRSGMIARNGAPARVYINAASYSLMVRDKQGRLIASELTISASVDASGITDGTLTEAKLDAALAAKINGALQTTGGTMTGAIVLPGNATSSLQAVPLQQLGSASALSFSALALSATGINANVSVTANEILLRATSGAAQVMSSVSITINTASTGANGLDTGTLSISTWYAVWVIWNGATTAGLISLSATSPTMPSGYTHKARVGWIRTDGTASKYPLAFNQAGNIAEWQPVSGTNLTDYPALASTTSTVSTPTAMSLASSVPSSAKRAGVKMRAESSSGACSASVQPSSSGASVAEVTCPSGSRAMATQWLNLTSTSVYYTSAIASGSALFYTVGWKDNL